MCAGVSRLFIYLNCELYTVASSLAVVFGPLSSFIESSQQDSGAPGAPTTVHLGWLEVEFLRSNFMDSRVGIQLPHAITMVLPKGILMKVPYSRARDHRVHHLQHHQHHLGRGPFWGLPICNSISSMGLIARDMRFFNAIDFEAVYSARKTACC